jgi:hypothetical protein
VTFGRWSKVRRPRARPRQPDTRAASGAPPGWPLRAACQELADDPGKVRTKAWPDAETRTPRWSAGRRAFPERECAALPKKARTIGWTPPGAPPPLPYPPRERRRRERCEGQKTKGEPGAFQTIRAAKRWLLLGRMLGWTGARERRHENVSTEGRLAEGGFRHFCDCNNARPRITFPNARPNL